MKEKRGKSEIQQSICRLNSGTGGEIIFTCSPEPSSLTWALHRLNASPWFQPNWVPSVASLPGSPTPEREYVYAARAWYLLSHDHDVIEKDLTFFEHCSCETKHQVLPTCTTLVLAFQSVPAWEQGCQKKLDLHFWNRMGFCL